MAGEGGDGQHQKLWANLILCSVTQTLTINWRETQNEFNDFLENEKIKVSHAIHCGKTQIAIKISRYKNGI